MTATPFELADQAELIALEGSELAQQQSIALSLVGICRALGEIERTICSDPERLGALDQIADSLRGLAEGQ